MRIAVHGHRGARAMRPENSLEAFAYAIEVGADAVELDIAVTRDNVLVVSHDPALTGSGEVIRETDLAGLHGRIPALEEVFQLIAPSAVELNLEVKSYPEAPQYTPPPEEFAAMLLRMIVEYGLQERAMVQSFDFRVVQAMKELAPGIRRGALFEGEGEDFVAMAAAAGGVHYVAPQYELVKPANVRAAHSAGMQVVSWTVNHPGDWARMADTGVDAIITDDPAALLAWLRARGLR